MDANLVFLVCTISVLRMIDARIRCNMSSSWGIFSSKKKRRYFMELSNEKKIKRDQDEKSH